MHLKIESEEELVNIFKELIHLSVNMRYWQKQWKEHYGSENRRTKEKWEERMDLLLERVNAKYQNVSKSGYQEGVKIDFTK